MYQPIDRIQFSVNITDENFLHLVIVDSCSAMLDMGM